jgi:hypothetical protein
MAIMTVYCLDTGTTSRCYDTITNATNASPSAVAPGPNEAYRIGKWDTVARRLTYSRASDVARLYKQLTAAPGVTPTDMATVTVSGAAVTALIIERSDVKWKALL